MTPIGEHYGSLRPGDVVVAVEGRSLEEWAEAVFQLTAPRLPFQMTPTYTVVRDGERLEIPVSLGPYPLAAIVAHHWGVILYLLILQVGGLALMLVRPLRTWPLVWCS